ncbi:oligosaccharide repeat unit polymerase [Thermoanaerobacteraceae bacterium SP2]|nr:oligosaccharide repeat unit polymerase [Thermoanaerobacteraceae bacterium SP2]
MVFVGILGCFMIMFFSWLKLKDLVAPSFILSAIWLLMYIIMLLRRNTVDLSSVYYISFFVGLCFFIAGFFLIVGNKNKRKCNAIEEKKSNLTFNPFFIKILLLAIIGLFLIYAWQTVNFILENYSFNFWQTLSIGRRAGTYKESFIISYSRIMILAFTLVSSIIFYSNPIRKNKRFFLISLIIASFFTVTGGNRGIMFMLVLAIFFSYIIVKNPKNIKVFFILQMVTLIILTIFIVFSFMKFVYQDQSNTFEFIMNHMRVYFSTSTLAFVQWAESSRDYLYGANTFRFFLAILNTIGYNIEVPRTVQEFVWVYGDLTNVYTVLYYYAKDFGLFYAFIIQLVLGMIHGFFYKRSVLFKGIRPFFIGVQSLLYFPLIDQFFDDKYFSIFSTWVQLVFWTWLFTRKGFLISTNKTIDEKR